MDNTNNANAAGFFQFTNNPTFAHFVRSLTRVNFNDSDDDTLDMPPLEPINSAANNQPAGQHVEFGRGVIASTSQPPIENATPNTLDVDNDDDDASMPELQSISDSSDGSESSIDADEVEAMQDLQAADDDNDSSWTDDDMPALEQVHPPPSRTPQASQIPRTNRRARVDDDEDQERDRRHPSQRIAGTTDPNNINQRPTPPSVLHFHIPTFVRIVSGPGPAPPITILQNIIAASAGLAPNQTPAQDADNRQPPATFPIFTGGFAVSLGTGPDNARPGPTHDHVNNGLPRPPLPFGTAPTGLRTETMDLNMFADLMGRFGPGMAQVFGWGSEREEQEDPERAQKLVDGLEEVPVGLVKRLERVGGAPGGHIDGEEASSPGCAICWDRLLDAEGDGFASKAKQNTEEVTTQPSDLSESSVYLDPSAPSTSAPTQSAESGTKPKIVSLPCAHVFHASCLLPWFSRPNQTTCPTCRFNIDPENLTYIRRPIPQTQTNAPPTQNAAAAGDVTANADPTLVVPPVAAPMPNNLETNLPQAFTPPIPPTEQNVPTDQPAPGTTPTPPPAPAPGADARNRDQAGFWTFGFDVVIEHGQETGEGNQNVAPEGVPIPNIDIAMDMGDQHDDVVDPTGEIRREAEAFAEQLLGSMGFNVAPAAAPTGIPAAGTDSQPQTTPFAMGNGAGPPFGGEAQAGNLPEMFTLPGHNGPIFPLPQGAQAFIPQRAPGTNTRGDPPPAGPPPARATVNPINPWGNFTQMFNTTGTNMPPGTLPGVGISFPFPVHAMNMPTPLRRAPPREKRPWSLPPAPGPTLRQRVEQKEREAGLRCYDVSCGVGPSDEEPCLEMCDAAMKQLRICPLRNDLSAGVKSSMCLHTFHPACLVSAERVALQGVEENFVGGEVPVSCPVCRAVGSISSEDWKEGVQALA